MDTKYFFWTFIISLVFISCERKNQLIDSTLSENDTIENQYGPYALMTILKFDNTEQLDKIIVQHQITGWDDKLECAQYNEEGDLSLNFYEISSDVVSFVEKELPIVGTSPYIPLTDGYFMIDWKWHQFMPLSALCLQNTKAYLKHINEHVFAINMSWKDMNSITTEYDRTNYTQHLEGIEIKRIIFMYLDMLYEDVKPTYGNPYYSCYGDGIYYYNGMCANTAYDFFSNGPCPYHLNETYQGYISYCDSLQNIYQQRMIEVIETGQLSKVEVTW